MKDALFISWHPHSVLSLLPSIQPTFLPTSLPTLYLLWVSPSVTTPATRLWPPGIYSVYIAQSPPSIIWQVNIFRLNGQILHDTEVRFPSFSLKIRVSVSPNSSISIPHLVAEVTVPSLRPRSIGGWENWNWGIDPPPAKGTGSPLKIP